MRDAHAVGPTSTAVLPLIDQEVTELAGILCRLPDAWLRRPSRLRGWTKGHVLTHLARVCDGLTRLAEGAIANQGAVMYDSRAHREHQIDAGATRSAGEQRDDLRNSWRHLRQTWVAPAVALRPDDRSDVNLVGAGKPAFVIGGSAGELAASLRWRSAGLTLSSEPGDPLPALPPWA